MRKVLGDIIATNTTTATTASSAYILFVKQERQIQTTVNSRSQIHLVCSMQATNVLDERFSKQFIVNVKTKAFRSLSAQEVVETKDTSLSANTLWKKYFLDTTSNNDRISVQVDHVRGVQFTVQNANYLFVVMDEQRFDQAKFEELLDAIGPDLNYQCLEKIGIAAAFIKPYEMMMSVGERIVLPPLYYAVQTENVAAVRALLRRNVDTMASQIVYPLQSTSITKVQLMNLGGTNFVGMDKIVDTFPGANNDKLKSGTRRADPTLVPRWEDVKCSWGHPLPPKPVLTPFQLAFSMQSLLVFEAMLEFDIVTSATGTLRLFTKRFGDTPCLRSPSLTNLVNITELYIEDANNTGTVPPGIFSMVNLKSLSLCGSGYTSISDDISKLVNLESIDVSNMKLTALPVVAMGKLRKLESLDCSGIKLASPPSEIVQRGPSAVATYIKDLGDGAEKNCDVLLMFIGDGEAGKTSTLKSLKNNESNVAGVIDVDDRTIGIDISEFVPFSDKPLRFFAWDFGGQGVYAIMQQLFMSRRALYPLLWRVRQSLDVSKLDAGLNCDVCSKPLKAHSTNTQESVYRVKGQGLCHASCVSYDTLVTSWTERLHFRVPGVSIVLICTHIDCANVSEVDDQCNAIAAVINRVVARQVESQPLTGIPPLNVFNNGQSLRVNNVTGEGIENLRKTLVDIATSMDSYGEVIPSSYVRLRQKLRDMQSRDTPNTWRTWLLWPEYADIAAECGIEDEEALVVATRFFHDIGDLRYYGKQQSHSRVENELLETTVFPNPYWVVDVLRGLIRHDHSTLLDNIKDDTSLSPKTVKTFRRRVYRLMQRGLLHISLLPYIWKGVAGGFDDAERNQDEFKRLISLMKAFDILMDKQGQSYGEEWVIPTLAAGKSVRSASADILTDDEFPFVARLVYDALPPFFDMILVAHIINMGIAHTVDFVEGAAAFRHLSDRAIVCAGMGKVSDPLSVFRRDQFDEGLLKGVLRADQCHVLIATSSRNLLIKLVREVGNLENFFPGLKRLCSLFPCYSCRVKRREQQKQSGYTDATELATNLRLLAEAEDRDEERKLDLLCVSAQDVTDIMIQLEKPNLKAIGEIYQDMGDVVKKINDAYGAGRGCVTPRVAKETVLFFSELERVRELNDTELAEKSSHAIGSKLIASKERMKMITDPLQQFSNTTLESATGYMDLNFDTINISQQICPELLDKLVEAKTKCSPPELLWFYSQIVDYVTCESGDDLPYSSFAMSLLIDLINRRRRDLNILERKLGREKDTYLKSLVGLRHEKSKGVYQEYYLVLVRQLKIWDEAFAIAHNSDSALQEDMNNESELSSIAEMTAASYQEAITYSKKFERLLDVDYIVKSFTNHFSINGLSICNFISENCPGVGIMPNWSSRAGRELLLLLDTIALKVDNMFITSDPVDSQAIRDNFSGDSFSSEQITVKLEELKCSNLKWLPWIECLLQRTGLASLWDMVYPRAKTTNSLEMRNLLSLLCAYASGLDSLLASHLDLAGVVNYYDVPVVENPYLLSMSDDLQRFICLNSVALQAIYKSCEKLNYVVPMVFSTENASPAAALCNAGLIWEVFGYEHQEPILATTSLELYNRAVRLFLEDVLSCAAAHNSGLAAFSNIIHNIENLEARYPLPEGISFLDAQDGSRVKEKYGDDVVDSTMLMLILKNRSTLKRLHTFINEGEHKKLPENSTMPLMSRNFFRFYNYFQTQTNEALVFKAANEFIDELLDFVRVGSQLSVDEASSVMFDKLVDEHSLRLTQAKELQALAAESLQSHSKMHIDFMDELRERSNVYVSEALLGMMKRLKCHASVCEKKLEVLTGIVDELKLCHFSSLESMVGGDNSLGPLLSKLASSDLKLKIQSTFQQLEDMVDARTSLAECVSDCRMELIKAVETKSLNRANEFSELMNLRHLYGPVWHFGCGVPVKRDQEEAIFEDMAWEEDWYKYVDGNNSEEILNLCPAERGEVEYVVQPADTCSVFISHTSENAMVAAQIKAAIMESGVGVKCVCTKDSPNSIADGINRVAISQSKAVITCIDKAYANTQDSCEEFNLAEKMKLTVIPVVLPDYTISTMQSWWPSEIPQLSNHSLFVDMRSVQSDDAASTSEICRTVLLPNLVAILNDWTPPPPPPPIPTPSHSAAPTTGSDVVTAVSQEAVIKRDNSVSKLRYQQMISSGFDVDDVVRCDQCDAEGQHSGTFDKVQCRIILAAWKQKELERRSNDPNYSPVQLCPESVECTGESKHTMSVRDVLATVMTRSTIPCPNCLRKGILPPHWFRREVLLAELEYKRRALMTCCRCHESTTLYDLLQSEVFISYAWGPRVCPNPHCSPSYWQACVLDGSKCNKCDAVWPSGKPHFRTQKLVGDLKVEIELEAGVTCWQDVDRLIGGKDLDHEMEAGIKHAEVVIIFLDDGYVRSVNCQKEYLFATKHGKYIIPVLLREYHSKSGDNVMWWPPSMSSLKQFSPILCKFEDDREKVIFEICERIQSRFHRSQRFPTTDDAVSYIRDYSSWGATRKAFLKSHMDISARETIDAHIDETFATIDTDGSKMIDQDELALFLDKNELSLSREQVETLIREADIDADGFISLAELKLAIYGILTGTNDENQL